MKQLLVLSLLFCSFVSCYRMPKDSDYCVVPTVNNPDITREKQVPYLPGVNY